VVAKNIEDNIKQFLKTRNLKADRRFVIFLFFVVLSTIFWFLNRLDEDYETEIVLPIRYSDFPADKILVNELPDQFKLRVKAHGFKLLEYKISNKFLPFPINVNKLTLRFDSRSNDDQLYALTRNLHVDIKRWLDSELEIIVISPDSLYFNFADRRFKKVPVKSKMNIVPATQFMLRGNILFSPDSITISGADPIVDTINQVYTKTKDLLELKENYNHEVKLEKIGNIDFSDKEVDVALNIEKFTEGSQQIKLNIINVPDSLILRTFPNEISVSYFVALSDYDKVLPQLFQAVIDYNEIEHQESKLSVKILNSPEYINTIRFNPEKVEYIIEKK
jgi:hypothetical protein